MSTDNCQPSLDDPVDILLVEDNPGDIRLIQEAFKAAESETSLQSVTTGDDAIDFLTEHAVAEPLSLPDLALVDLNLPGKDGCEVIEAVRNDPELKPLPMIMLTSSEASEDIERCYDAEANAYLTKPRDPTEFSSLAKSVETFWFKQVQFPLVSQ